MCFVAAQAQGAGDSDPVNAHYVELLSNDGPSSIRQAAQSMHRSGVSDERVLDVAAEVLLRDYKSATSGAEVDALAWITNALSHAKTDRYNAVLQEVKENAAHKKLAKYADKNFNKQLPAGEAYVAGTVDLAKVAAASAAATPAPGVSAAPAGSYHPISVIKAGMSRQEVMALAGPPTATRNYQTGKAFIPFNYRGGDLVREEALQRSGSNRHVQHQSLQQGLGSAGSHSRQWRVRLPLIDCRLRFHEGRQAHLAAFRFLAQWFAPPGSISLQWPAKGGDEMTNYSMLIDGQLVVADRTFPVINPADESVVAQAPNASDADLDRAVSAAERAFKTWSNTGFEERRGVLLKIADIIEENSAELIDLLISEQGKSRAQAEREILQQGAAGLKLRAEMKLQPEVLQDDDKGRVELHYRPLGVAAAIVPWNFPFGIAIGKLATALMAGCTLVLKPSPFTPLSTLRLGELVKDVVPAGVLNILSGDDSFGPKLTAHPGIKKISFTGSIATGKKVMQSAAADLKRVTLELGGNDAAIVLDDVDVEKIARPLFMGAFVNSGQTCVAIKRVYAHESIYEPLVNALADIARQTRVGPGSDPESVLGPVQNRLQYQRVLAVLDSVKSGQGRIVAGGELHEGKGYFLKPTIVADVQEGCPLVDDETFGPILPVIKYTDVQDAVARANATEYGLGGSVWSSDSEKAANLARQLNTGTAWVNQHPALSPLVPFAGAKQSGLGVESTTLGLEEFCQIHAVNIRK